MVHEIHRVPTPKKEEYLDFMTRDGLRTLKEHGFRVVGPWLVDVGRSSEVTYLLRYESLDERQRLKVQFAATAAGRSFDDRLSEFAEEITTRVLVPAPFALPATASDRPPKAGTSSVLPHREQLAPRVFVAGFSDRHGSANSGWVSLGDETLLIDLPRGVPVGEFLAVVAASTGKPARTLVLTRGEDGDGAIVRSLIEAGITPRFQLGQDAHPAACDFAVARSGDLAHPRRSHARGRRRRLC